MFPDGGDGSDNLIGTNKNDTVAGNLGNDTIDGRGGGTADVVVATRNTNMILSNNSLLFANAAGTDRGDGGLGVDTAIGVEIKSNIA